MQWDWQSRRLKLSVGELARFSLLAPVEEAVGRWRMELGSHWHGVLRERAQKEETGWTFEQPVAGSLQQHGWRFELSGRIDQLRAGAPALLREIKTISLQLPAAEADLRARYPQHFHQAMLYAFLHGMHAPMPDAELVFLEIQTGVTQTVRLGELDLEALDAHLTAAVATLEERRGHFSLLRDYVVPEPFPDWRPGQPEAREALDAACESARIVLFEAPTGFGKTGLALEQALCRLAAGSIERILLLTSKNTGHAPLLNQLETFREAGAGLAIHALRSRRDHELNREAEAEMSPGEIAERWLESGLSAPRLLAGEIPTLERIKSLGAQHGIPPWAITRMLLPFADIWLADYNYLFDPAVCGVPESIPTFDPARTLLIVDEAHNLPERAAASRSHLLDAGVIDRLLGEVQFANFPAQLPRLLDVLLTIVKSQTPCEALEPAAEADLLGLLRELDAALRETGFGDGELGSDSLEWLWNLPYLLADWDHPQLPMHVHCPAKGRVLISCLDASAVIAPVLRRFHGAILMSATMRPWPDFRAATGLPAAPKPPARDDVAGILGAAPWLEGCFEVLVDARADTRFRQRERSIDLTAATIAESALSGKGCMAAFFPSYLYASQVLERIAFRYPALRCELQPRDLPLEEQTAFLENALRMDDVLFLVLGSRFSEGIDALGGRVQQAIVVGPALPEVNALQKAREAVVPGGPRAAFRTVYLIPGLRKISQALGRLVRSPDQRARVLLHDKRFLEPDYLDLLPSYLQPVDHIVTDQDFSDKWLNVP